MELLQRYLKDPIANSEFLKYKASITGKTTDGRNTKEFEFSVPLTHLGTFWRTLDMRLINCKVSLTLTWSKNCVFKDMTTRDAEGDNPVINTPIDATFTIFDAKLYIP